MFYFFCSGSAWPVTLGLGVGLGAGYSNCRHQFFWHGPRGPLFGRPPWGGGRELWAGYGKDGKFKHPPCHEDWKVGYGAVITKGFEKHKDRFRQYDFCS